MVDVRWERLFDDLEAQLALDEARELDGEVADRTRRERAQVDLQARLLAHVSVPGVRVRLRSGTLEGPLVDVGPDWLLVGPRRDKPVLVPFAAVRGMHGLGPAAEAPSVVAKRLTLGSALRAISRDRAAVDVVDVDGQSWAGTIDAVAADHIELAVHPADEPRRNEHVTDRLVLPLWALESVRRV